MMKLNAQAVVMCYDITNYDSFQNLDDWYRLVVKTFANGTMPYVAMVGNKCETPEFWYVLPREACEGSVYSV